jgi:phosphatidylserine/phosphatidylglycerophosphate/cardiolipin synthase-like enzyme
MEPLLWEHPPLRAEEVNGASLCALQEPMSCSCTTTMLAPLIDSASAVPDCKALLVTALAGVEFLVQSHSTVTNFTQGGLVPALEAQEQQQPLPSILRANPVVISKDNDDIVAMQSTLLQLDQLIAACSDATHPNIGRAPGWWTADLAPDLAEDATKFQWKPNTYLPVYETLHCTPEHVQDLPVPSPNMACRMYQAVKKTMLQRFHHQLRVPCASRETGEFCSCISRWEPAKVVLRNLVNQVMEQAMVEEASSFLMNTDPKRLHEWDQLYDAATNARAMASYKAPTFDTPMQLVSHRDHYMHLLVGALLAAQHSVIISTCYLFTEDQGHLYILMDVLPYLASKGVKVYFFIDLFAYESNIMASPFQVKKDQAETTAAWEDKDKVTQRSFADHIPPGSPTPSWPSFQSRLDLFDHLLQRSLQSNSNFELRFWCARDPVSGYRIKNHAKGIVVDDQWAIFGGSNLTPTIKSAITDLDCIVIGPAAQAIGDSFWNLWNALDNNPKSSRPQVTYNPELAPERFFAAANGGGVGGYHGGTGAGCFIPHCTLSLLQSTPSSAGDDAIYRVVLDHIESARESITVNMGHCCFPVSFSDALERACARGVSKIQLMVNSYLSSDLRGGQQDLFFSIRVLLQKVPNVEVYATYHQEGSPRPEFLHGKYVIVDGKWSAVGSWNLWTRACFYELELEAFVESDEVASMLQAKFDVERERNAVLVTLEDCEPGGKFCPLGCPLCRPFGPFFVQERIEQSLFS